MNPRKVMIRAVVMHCPSKHALRSASWILVRAIDELYGTTYTMHNSAIKSEARCRPFKIERCAHIAIATKQAVQESKALTSYMFRSKCQKNYERTNTEKELRALSRVSPAIVPSSGSTMLHNPFPVATYLNSDYIPPTILLLPLEIIWPQYQHPHSYIGQHSYSYGYGYGGPLHLPRSHLRHRYSYDYHDHDYDYDYDVGRYRPWSTFSQLTLQSSSSQSLPQRCGTRPVGDERGRELSPAHPENATTRIWFCCRSSVVVSEPFDFIAELQALVELFAAFAFADRRSLGFYATMVRTPGDPTHFIITIHPHHDSGKPRRFRTRQIISSSAIEVEDGGKETRGPVVLKDIWIDHDRMREGDILTQLYNDVDGEDKRLAKKHFLTPICHGDVLVAPDTADDTRDIMRRLKTTG
ncbi:hypothetical protein BS47DRAFT_1487893 [Hydnum rufescens UP504]|uniref:Fungal-type protein kinase domain-containing protein n=1 Tax=Hydnum rufescens UP504 TaxID=1448309 RepID=A0A9P6APC9_9AGAM|nr:hypothetical protein BS47DRAFT_1487893 [Hydnum rufescens UP504]